MDAQERYTMSGYLRDASNGEELIGATVYIKELGTRNASDHNRSYLLTLEKGTYNLVFSYVGFKGLGIRV